MDQFFVVKRDGQFLSEDGTWGTVATAARFVDEANAQDAASSHPGASAIGVTGYTVTQSKWVVAGGQSSDEASSA